MGASVCFILGELGPSGGVGAVLRHARGLARDHGLDVSVAVWDEAAVSPPEDVRVVGLDEARATDHDVAIATWWRTAYALFDVPAWRRAYFVQQLEERVYAPDDVERFGAALTHDLPVAFLTEARWIADTLAELRPEAPLFHVPNGVDKQRFAPGDRPERHDGPLRVLVEGSPALWFKGVREAADALREAREPVTTTLVAPEAPDGALAERFDRVVGPLSHAEMADAYRDADVLLKLSRVEGVFIPPLEAFHCGATCVVWPVTGHEEYVRHGVNGAVVDFDDIPGTAAWIDLLARDRGLLDRLRAGALRTAAAWPSWPDATADLAAALERILAEPPPAPGDGGARLLAELDGAMATQRIAHRRVRREGEIVRRRLDARLAEAERRLAAIEATKVWRARERVHGAREALRRRRSGRD